MRRILAVLVITASALAGSSVWAANARRVLITFKAGTPEARRQKALSAMNAKAVDTILSKDREQRFIVVVAELAVDAVVPAGLAAGPDFSILAGGGDIGNADGVVKVEADFRDKWIEEAGLVSLAATPFMGGSSLAELGLEKFTRVADAARSIFTPSSIGERSEIPWGLQRVKAPAVWDFNEGAGAMVAVIDTGIDTNHPDLRGKVDGGYNAITDSEQMGAYVDDNGHGTHVAGTIGALRDGKGVVGVAPKARLYGVKVLDADGSGNLSDVVKGVIWCANNGIQVANMSLGSRTPSETLRRALMYAKSRGVIVVAAAGNSGESVAYPGAYPETIAVSASDWSDGIAAFSSRGPEVKFIAPGVDIVSTMLGGDYQSLSGTSMAAPHVAGLAALAVALGYRGLDGPDGVLAALRKAAKPLQSLSATEQGVGMIDASRLSRSR